LIPLIPDCPKDKKFDIKYLAKRAAYLEDFLNKALQSDDLKILPIVLDFLKDPDRRKFSKHIKSSLEKAPKPSCVKEFYTVSGSHIIDSNKHIITFSEKLSTYLNVNDSCYAKFNDMSKKLASQMMETSKTMNELADCAKYFSKMYKLCDCKQFSKLYSDIQNSFERWSAVQNNLTKAISSNLASFYTIPTLHLNALKRLETVKQSYQSLFEKSDSYLEKKKERAFKSRDFMKWELSSDDLKRSKDLLEDKAEAWKAMFPRESIENNNLKNNYFFVANK